MRKKEKIYIKKKEKGKVKSWEIMTNLNKIALLLMQYQWKLIRRS